MMLHHGSTAVWALVAGLAVCGSVARPAAAQRQIGMGKSVTDTLSAADPVLPSDRSPYKLFSFYGAAGQTVRIDLMSAAFDARLYLQDWEGLNIAESDDSGGAQRARIWYDLPFTGIYQILAGARRSGQHGPFSLSVTATEAHAMPPNANPPQLVTNGAIGFNQQVKGIVADGTPTYDHRMYHAYDFQCSAGQQLQMDILSGWDNYAIVVDPGGNIVARDNDSGGGTNARIVHTCAATGLYRLVVTTSAPAASAGRYTLRVQAHGATTVALAQRQPVAQAQPVVPAQPVSQPQPVAQGQPVPQPRAVAQPQAAPQSQPVVMAEPVPQPHAAVQPQPVVRAQPVPQPQPVPPSQPAVQSEPVSQPPQAAQAQPVVRTQPVPRAQVAQPQALPQPPPAAQPAVVNPPPAPADATPTGAIPGPGEVGQIAIGQTKQGRLEPGDPTVADTFEDTWQFQGSAGLTVTIDVKSRAFSTYVQLFDGNGNKLAEDGGSGGGNNSRLVFLLRSAGTYQITVVSGDIQRATGLYTISIR